MGRKPKILVVGSFVMDTISSTREFPEAGQTVLGLKYRTAPGGKGANQAMEAQLLGAEVTMVGKVGQDAFGDRLIQSLEKVGVHTEHVLRDPDEQSAVGNVILQEQPNGQTQNRIIVLPGANMTITPDDVAFLKNSIKDYDMVILQLEIPMEINQIVAGYAYDAGVPVMLNPAPIAPIPHDLMRHITYLSPNETEAAGLLDCFIREEGHPVSEEAVRGIRAAMKEKGLQKILITLGDAGAMVVTQDDVVTKPCVRGIKAIDPTAAGDSFVGAFCTAVCVGLSESEALEFANMIAAVTVSRMGAQPSLSTLMDAIQFHENAGRSVDILRKMQKQMN